MSGVEAINLVQLIGACISITETVIEIGRAAQDPKGLISKLKELFERLPATNDLLQAANERTETDEVSEEIRGLFHKACPEDGNNYGKHFWKGTETAFLGRDSKLQKHMNNVVENLKILELKGVSSIDGKLGQLAETVQVLAEEEIAVRKVHSGSGNLNAHEGPRQPVQYWRRKQITPSIRTLVGHSPISPSLAAKLSVAHRIEK